MPKLLTNDESLALLQSLATVSDEHVPLHVGLRVAADEADGPRVQDVLRFLGERVEQGQSLVEALNEPTAAIPGHIISLVAAAQQTGSLHQSLLDLTECRRQSTLVHRNFRRELAYPIVVLTVCVPLIVAVLIVISETCRSIVLEFDLVLPYATQVLFWWREVGLALMTGLFLVAVAILAAIRFKCGPVTWSRCLAALPIVGSAIRAAHLAEWFGVAGVLTRQRLSLPDALRLSGGSQTDPWLTDRSRRWADEVAAGQSFREVTVREGAFPRSLIPFIAWGEEHRSLSDALTTCGDVMKLDLEARLKVLRFHFEGILVIGLGCAVVQIVIGFFAPLISLIQGLS